MVATDAFDEQQQQVKETGSTSSIRRQVSDLGMEDPIINKPNGDKDKNKNKGDGDSTASTSGHGEDDNKTEKNTASLKNLQCTNIDEDGDDLEMDLDDLMSIMSQRTGITRSTSSGGGSRSGSLALRAMSDSFTHGSFSSASSFNDSTGNLNLDLNLNVDGSNSNLDCNDNDVDTVYSSAPNTPITSGAPPRRKLPQRTGSGYVRGNSRNGHSENPKIRRSLRTSIIKNQNGLAVSAAALKEKRRSSNLSSSQRILQLEH